MGGGNLPFNKVRSKLWFVVTFTHPTSFQTGPITNHRRLWDKNMFLLTGSRSPRGHFLHLCIATSHFVVFFFSGHFLFRPRFSCSFSALLEMSKSALALWSSGFLVSGAASFMLPRLLPKLSVTSAAFVVTTHNMDPIHVDSRITIC